MNATSEIEIKVSNARIIAAKVLNNGVCKLTVETAIKTEEDATTQRDIFEPVKASTLSLEDKFMRHEPTTDKEKKFKKLLTQAIKGGLKDFYCPKCDPSFKEDVTGICYVPGKWPAVDMSYNWWNKTAKAFCPERNSRLGTKKEYIAFLGMLIKRMVANGWTVGDAWYAVCNDSKELGHYWNSEDAKHTLEATGSREVCGFCDLANTFKILDEDEEAGGFWLAGGVCYCRGISYPLADLYLSSYRDDDDYRSVGWLVLEK